jgi:hypothetical protein
MRKTRMALLTLLFFGLIFSTALWAGEEKEIQKTFDKKDRIKLKLVLGDMIFQKSSDNKIHVHLVYDYAPKFHYKATLEDKGRYLYFKEKLNGNNVRGSSTWTISVPDDTEIDFKTATGDLSISGLTVQIEGNTGTGEIEIDRAKGEFDIRTGTGYIEIVNSEGEFDVGTGTGKILIENSKGDFEASSGTGKVEVIGIILENEGDFSCGTGDVEVIFPTGDNFDLYIRSGTDDAVLEMKGKPITGYFEFTCHARKGKIVSPVKFDIEEEYEDGDNDYLRKSFTKGKDTPRVFIKTGTGTARLKK